MRVPQVAFRSMDDDLDFSVLTDDDLRERIARVELSADSEPLQRKLDVMRAELINRLRSSGRGRGDSGGPDDPSGVREPRRPRRPSGSDAIQLRGADDAR
jgi:hypothetical protein